MKYIDFLFYSYYCYFERRNKRVPKFLTGNSKMQALCIFSITIGFPIGVCYGLINDYVISMPAMPKLNSPEEKLIGIVVGGAIMGPLIYRYLYDNKITKGYYKTFKDRWGEDPRTQKRGRIAVLVYTFVSLTLPLYFAIMHS